MSRRYTIRKWIQLLVISAVLLATLIVGGNAVITSFRTVKGDYIKMAEIATNHLLTTLESGGGEWRYDAVFNGIIV